ncbi:DUF2017 domain-containing protein [Gleimia sp. 6138-11-ORH1]|uniref:DUF2017 domain-containing protein n=1 Tax=Gleimia sp. 6138-11-ORH1 TaxID=2973937 RepID=UPI00216A0999|nr:DUF2017 domain-containing protein [Gleimia sp. 6138-11-ORH1]MCS4483894.1 DUF2017 domain-containing protein [Gleimia sp. 6138-11-ORH1]
MHFEFEIDSTLETQEPYLLTVRQDFSELIIHFTSSLILTLDPPVGGMDILASLCSNTLIEQPPTDPVLRHLLPDMSIDPDEAIELRSLTEETLRYEKAQRLMKVRQKLAETLSQNDFAPEIEIPYGQVWEWLSAFNDLRLFLAVRLCELGGNPELVELDEVYLVEQASLIMDEDSTLNAENALESVLSLAYLVVSWWQDSLLEKVNSTL